MAHLFSFFVLIISVTFLPLALSRSLSSPPHKSQILDVAKSIQNTLHVLSPKFQSFQQEAIKQPLYNSSSSSSSAFSVSIYPRSSLAKTQHNNYTSLTLSRLARDSVRVSSLTTMLQLEEIQTPVTSGASEGSGEYFARVGFGQPVKEFYMAIDTGSDITWLQCELCSECYNQIDQIFNPSNSSTYTGLSCDSPECSVLHLSECSSTGTCLYQVSYGDGSFTVGEFATETVSLGNSGGSSFSNVAIGCGHDNEGLFIGSAGLLALGSGSLSLPSQIKATSFSYCLVDRDSDSSSTLEFNSAGPSDSIIAPLLQNSKRSTFFYVGLEGISIAGEMLSVPANIFQVDDNGNGGIIVDSGTAVTRFERSVYNALRDTFVKYAQDLPADGDFMLFDTCYDLSGMKTASVPTVAFHFPGGKTLSLHPKNTLVPVNSSGKFCLAFAPEDGKFSIIGNIQQQGTRVSYDLANNLVGFSPHKCLAE